MTGSTVSLQFLDNQLSEIFVVMGWTVHWMTTLLALNLPSLALALLLTVVDQLCYLLIVESCSEAEVLKAIGFLMGQNDERFANFVGFKSPGDHTSRDL